MDTKQIIGGDWEREIKRGLRHANLFIACLSHNTAQPGEVLRFEYASALEIEQERLEGEIFIVPVRLEPCEIPEAFRKLQTVDLYDQDGWDNLVRAVRSKSPPSRLPLLAAALTLVLAAVGAYIWLQPTAQADFLAARVAGKSAAFRNPSNSELRCGRWKHPATPIHRQSARSFIRTGPATKKPARSNGLRFVSRRALYFAKASTLRSELKAPGKAFSTCSTVRTARTAPSAASMIFPTNRIRSGENQVWPDNLLRLPDRTSDPPYWEFTSERPDYGGEMLIVLLSPDPIPDLPAGPESQPVADDTLSYWNTKAGKDVRLRNFRSSATSFDDRGSRLARWSCAVDPNSAGATVSFRGEIPMRTPHFFALSRFPWLPTGNFGPAPLLSVSQYGATSRRFAVARVTLRRGKSSGAEPHTKGTGRSCLKYGLLVSMSTPRRSPWQWPKRAGKFARSA